MNTVDLRGKLLGLEMSRGILALGNDGNMYFVVHRDDHMKLQAIAYALDIPMEHYGGYENAIRVLGE